MKTVDPNTTSYFVAEPGPSSEYYIGGFTSSDWFSSERPLLVVTTPNSEIIILVAQFEKARAQLIRLPGKIESRVTWLPWSEGQDPYKVLLDHLTKEHDRAHLLIDEQVRFFIVRGLMKAGRRDQSSQDVQIMQQGVSSTEQKELDLEPIWSIRERKDEREIGLLTCANQMTVHAIRQTRRRMHIGIRESETRQILKNEMAKTGLKGGGDGLVLFAENAALPHGSGSDRKLGKEDLVLIDVGGRWGGYIADVTRTFALPASKIPQAHIDIWETVRQAQLAPYHLLKSSNTTSPPKFNSLDAAARNIISHDLQTNPKEGEADFSVFTHRLGHGIGLEGHESPYLVPGAFGETKVKSGNTFSLEPGVYLPEGSEEARKRGLKGLGVRLEDCFAVTEDVDGRLGGKWLSGPVEKWGEI